MGTSGLEMLRYKQKKELCFASKTFFSELSSRDVASEPVMIVRE
jgi:hypothetical protein